MDDLIYTATPESDDLDSVEVRVVGLKKVSIAKKPDIELYRDGKKIELERPGRAYLDVVSEVSNPTPVLRLTSSYVEQVFGLGMDDVAVKLDRDWKKEFEEYKDAVQREKYASAREMIENNPNAEVKIDRSFGRTTGYFARGVEDEEVREYLNHLLSTLDDGVGVGEDFDYQPEWDGGGYCETTAGEILRRADEKKEQERKERERKKREKRERREAEQEAAEGREILRFHCELQPHKEDLSDTVLNRAAPQGGAFLMHRRIPEEKWSKLKDDFNTSKVRLEGD